MGQEIISENTRKIRRSLLTASLIGVAISIIDVSIRKVTVFGTEFNIGNFEGIPYVLGVIIFYLWITFLAYAFEEYQQRYKSERSKVIDKLINGEYLGVEDMVREARNLENELIPQLEKRVREIVISRTKSEKKLETIETELNSAESELKELQDKKRSLEFELSSELKDSVILEIKTEIEPIGKKISGLATTIDELKREKERIQHSIQKVENYLNEKIIELNKANREFGRLKSVRSFDKATRRPIWELRHTLKFRHVIELYLPVIVGAVAMVVVFFFTEFKVELSDTSKPKATVQTDQVIIQRASGKMIKNKRNEDLVLRDK